MTLSSSVIIVTYNGWTLLDACLRSLREQERAPDEIVVVDNGSSDGTVEHLGRQYAGVVVVDAGRNLGFAAGNNLGIERASGDALILVNNDLVAEPEFVGSLLAPLEADSALGSVAATMVFANAPDTVASAGIDVFTNGLALDRALGSKREELAGSTPVFGASAGAAAYRRAALDDVGTFFAPLFMYLEDVDLAWRLRLRGWSSVHAAGAVARHRYSASAVEGSPAKRRLLARNRLWVIARCLPSRLLARHLGQVAFYDLLAIGYGVARRDTPALRGRLEALRGLRPRLRERRAIQARATVPARETARWLRRSPSPREVVRLRTLTASLASQANGHNRGS